MYAISRYLFPPMSETVLSPTKSAVPNIRFRSAGFFQVDNSTAVANARRAFSAFLCRSTNSFSLRSLTILTFHVPILGTLRQGKKDVRDQLAALSTENYAAQNISELPGYAT